MTPEQTKIKSVLLREGAEAIYKERLLVAHVRLHNIKANEDGMEADVTLLKTLATPTPDVQGTRQWKIFSVWSNFGELPDKWETGYGGWSVFFDKSIINCVLEFSDELPENVTVSERCKKVRAALAELYEVNMELLATEARVEAGIENFRAEVDAGEQGLIAKYGPTTDLKDLMDWSLNSGFEEMENMGEKHKVPIATAAQVSFTEQWIRTYCAPYELHIGEMTVEELEAFKWNHFLAQDYNRGKMPGQAIPPRIFRHSEEFKRWEESILNKIATRMKETGE